jgi:hypothetical protein
MAEIHELVIRHGREAARALARNAEERRLIDLAAEVLAEEHEAIGISYAGFCMVSLPHRDPGDKAATWFRENGRYSMLVEPGHLIVANKPKPYGIPYGSRARLILLYLCSEALRKNTRRVEIGGSMHEWVRRMSIAVCGWNYSQIREQAMRLSACRLTIGWRGDDGSEAMKRENLVGGMITMAEDRGQQRLWKEEVELTESFFQALKTHPVPISETAIRMISNQSLVIDIYIWLAYRLYAVKKPVTVPWLALKNQFGPEYDRVRDFKRRFTQALQQAIAVYPDANVAVSDDGLVLKPSRPAIPERKILAIGAR